ncbi:unnamed protein product [Hymenolepis diminuta]|uniref:Uncharacterized protein n=1 Tax=Hymenolepis diminuta TaxID=6216 RepID=A0A564XYT9_HYMDI|nr:unnamed protein product [Hymenolepis diminuta]
MSERVHRFPLFSITASLRIKGTSTLMLWRGLTQVTHKATLVFQTITTHACQLWASRPHSLPLSLLLVVVSLSTFLVYSTLGVLLHNCC